jgi:predicted metal-dependent hydrolase
MTDILIKENKRAKRVILRTCPKEGIILIKPPRVGKRVINDFLKENEAWIAEKTALFKKENNFFPTHLPLQALNENWKIDYQSSIEKKTCLIARPEKELVLFGKVDEATHCRKLIKKWYREYATPILTNWLNTLSDECALPYSRLIIRTQKGQWGACSHDKMISLNDRLLLLPYPQVRYVLLHELCHTIHLNHSHRFWQLVKKYDPNFSQHCREIRKIEKDLVQWLY